MTARLPARTCRDVAIQKLTVARIAVDVIALLRSGLEDGASRFTSRTRPSDSIKNLLAIRTLEERANRFEAIAPWILGHRNEFVKIAALVGNAALRARRASAEQECRSKKWRNPESFFNSHEH